MSNLEEKKAEASKFFDNIKKDFKAFDTKLKSDLQTLDVKLKTDLKQTGKKTGMLYDRLTKMAPFG